jgi:SAM-dependent methyltransferase
VQRVYDSIAHEWHGTRYKPWPRVAEFIQRQPRGTLFADAGCGNGKNWAACAERGYALGSDFSVELLKICRGLGHEVHSADALALPYRDGAFDALLSIAVLHHISSEDRRMRLMAEALRVLRVGGQAIFYAWAFEQDKGKARSGHVFAAQDVLVPWHVRIGAKHASAAERAAAAAGVVERAVASHGEVDVAKGAAVFQRYCHVYVEGELEQLFARMLAGQPAMDARVCEVYYDSGNWAMHVQRLR